MSIELFFRVLIAVISPVSDADAEGLHRFAPNDVTVERAYDHIWSARVAAAVHSVDEALVLAISYHESHFTDNVVSHESGGRVSCGTMTPYPQRSCTSKPLLAQYLDGARHLAGWLHAGDVRNQREALLGYARGYYLIRACRQGPVLRHETSGDDLCKTPEVFGWMRSRIRAARQVRLSS